MSYEVPADIAHKIFPFTPRANISKYLPDISQAAQAAAAGRTLFVLALATIRAEVESFIPCCEEISRYNTSIGGKPFDLYDPRKDLGNQGSPDGERFRGRGYIQLTGRANYARLGAALSLDLIRSPELAAQSAPAARILFAFLTEKKDKLTRFINAGDLASARRAVNGGFHGLTRFREAFTIADSTLPKS